MKTGLSKNWKWQGGNIIKGDGPSPRSGHVAVNVENFVLLFGGCELDQQCFDDVYLLDTDHNMWLRPNVAGETMPSPRQGHTATMVGMHMYMYGGSSFSGNLGDVFALDMNMLPRMKAYTNKLIREYEKKRGKVQILEDEIKKARADHDQDESALDASFLSLESSLKLTLIPKDATDQSIPEGLQSFWDKLDAAKKQATENAEKAEREVDNSQAKLRSLELDAAKYAEEEIEIRKTGAMRSELNEAQNKVASIRVQVAEEKHQLDEAKKSASQAEAVLYRLVDKNRREWDTAVSRKQKQLAEQKEKVRGTERSELDTKLESQEATLRKALNIARKAANNAELDKAAALQTLRLLHNNSGDISLAWRQLSVSGSAPPSREGHTAAAFGSRIVYFGGYTQKGYSNQLFVLDTALTTWEYPDVKGPVPLARHCHTAVAYQNNVCLWWRLCHWGIE
jgi:hypothetical protein